jgi:hypothetical protein
MRHASRLLLAAGLVLCVPLASHATVADDICGPMVDPCVVTTKITVDPSSQLDFGTRTFRIAAGGGLTWSEDLEIIAGACEVEAGAALAESSQSSGIGFLELTCTSTTLAGKVSTVGAGILVEGDGPHLVSGKVKAKGDNVGVIAIDSYGLPGDITITGKIQAKSKLGPPPGEFRLETNFGDIMIGEKAKIQAKGVTADPFSEFFIVVAHSGTLTIQGQIQAGAKLGAYGWNLEADQDVLFDLKSKIKAGAKETGSEIAINSQSGTVRLRGQIQAKTSDADLGDGSKVHVCAGNDVIVTGKGSIDTSSGFLGSIIIGAGDQAIVGELPVFGSVKLISKDEGDIEVCGGFQGIIFSSRSTVIPDPEAVGTTGDCLSPTSQVFFELDCGV